MPPNHYNSDLQINIPSGSKSRLVITVAPVVVIPLTDSKKASVKESRISEIINGIDANIGRIIHDRVVIRNA